MSYLQLSQQTKDPFGQVIDPYGHANKALQKEVETDPLAKAGINRGGSYLGRSRNLGLKSRDQLVSGVTGRFTNEASPNELGRAATSSEFLHGFIEKNPDMLNKEADRIGGQVRDVKEVTPSSYG